MASSHVARALRHGGGTGGAARAKGSGTAPAGEMMALRPLWAALLLWADLPPAIAPAPSLDALAGDWLEVSREVDMAQISAFANSFGTNADDILSINSFLHAPFVQGTSLCTTLVDGAPLRPTHHQWRAPPTPTPPHPVHAALHRAAADRGVPGFA